MHVHNALLLKQKPQDISIVRVGAGFHFRYFWAMADRESQPTAVCLRRKPHTESKALTSRQY